MRVYTPHADELPAYLDWLILGYPGQQAWQEITYAGYRLSANELRFIGFEGVSSPETQPILTLEEDRLTYYPAAQKQPFGLLAAILTRLERLAVLETEKGHTVYRRERCDTLEQ